MKRTGTFLLTLALILALLSGCTTGNNGSETGNNNGGDAGEKDDLLKIAYMVHNNLGDLSFFDSGNAGIQRLAEDGIAEVKTIEVGGDQTKFQPTLEDLSNGDYDIVVCGSWEVQEALEAVAANHPEVHYIYFDNTLDYTDGAYANVYSLMYNCNESSFLAGAFAAMVTTSDMPNANAEKVLGFLGGQDATNINDFLVGYIQGAQYVDPEIRVATGYIGDFTDSMKCKEMALSQFDLQGVDVGYAAAGNAGLGVLDAAKESGRYAIGVNTDQAMIFAESDPDKANAILTSVVIDIGASIYNAVVKLEAGEAQWGTCENVGLESGVMYLAKNEFYEKNVPDDIKEQISALEEKAFAGEIDILSAYTMDETELADYLAAARPQ